MKKIAISVITPFYKGNQYLERLIDSVNKVVVEHCDRTIIELILVNDSPEEEIVLPVIKNLQVEIRVYKNEKNQGIQKTRVNGLGYAKGEWIIFLDQDDELVSEGFGKQLDLTKNADVIVGNALYEFKDGKRLFFKNLKTMTYLIKEKRFIEIHNMIPSPGECLIKKDAIPEVWKKSSLKNNGSDDYLLWIIMFSEKKTYMCNEHCVYIHNDAAGNNLSLDLDKMYESSVEMCSLLELESQINKKNINRLRKSVEFKYYQDTKKITFKMLFGYLDVIWNNIKCKVIKTML